MSILIDKKSQIICHGATGRQGELFIKKSIKYENNIVAGVSPGRGGQEKLGVKIYNKLSEIDFDASLAISIIMVPAPVCKYAIIEAIEGGVKLIVCITEGIPVHDMLEIKPLLKKNNVRLIGPNTFGIITPSSAMAGIMPSDIFSPGKIGVVSRSGTLAYEIVYNMTKMGLGQSTCVGVGGDSITGSSLMDILELFENDIETDKIVLIGEIGGYMENDVAANIHKISKPVFSYIAGVHAPKRKRMGHAGAIINRYGESVAHKIKVLKKAGIVVIDNPFDIVKVICDYELRKVL